jgi:hypothetical protein
LVLLATLLVRHLGCQDGDPGRWDCAGVSSASDVTVVVALHFGHGDGEE